MVSTKISYLLPTVQIGAERYISTRSPRSYRRRLNRQTFINSYYMSYITRTRSRMYTLDLIGYDIHSRHLDNAGIAMLLDPSSPCEGAGTPNYTLSLHGPYTVN